MKARPLAQLVMLVVAVSVLAPACRKKATPRISAEQAILERRHAGLTALLERARKGPLPFNQVMVVVDQSLVQQLLSSALPFQRVVNGQYQVTVDTAIVSFDDAFALIKLGGRVAMVSQPDNTFADVAVYGALDVVELDPSSGVLRGRVNVIGLDASKVSVMGVATTTAEDLLEEFAGERVGQLDTLFSNVEIPVKLQKEIVIPAFGPEGPVSIKEARIPVAGAVTDVTAYRSRLYITIDATICKDDTGTAGGAGHGR